MATIRDVIKAIETRYPLSRAEKWDRVGLQIGDAGAGVSRVLVAHEVDESTVYAARGHDALVIYHPLLFRPLENLDFKNHTARLAARCIAQNLHVIAVHTALDGAAPPHALGDHLARQLGLREVEVLSPSGREALWKIVVFVPPEALEKVSEALWDAGAGKLGDYERTAFRNRGTGTFRPLPGADPYDGEVGKQEEADEWRLEVIIPETKRDAAVAAMIEAHPYEAVAYDLYALHESINPYGSARMGTLVQSASLNDWAQQVLHKLSAPNLRLVRAQDRISKVACVPGAGASYIEAAVRAGCDCLVTGDIKHHDALKARAHGLSIVDATHTATERAAVPLIAEALQSTLHGVEVTRCDIDTNPFAAG
jgi:dinuclear metal center YbgI/SA1388 family protein